MLMVRSLRQGMGACCASSRSSRPGWSLPGARISTIATLVLVELAELVKPRTIYRERPRQFSWRLPDRNILFQRLPVALIKLALNTPDSLSAALVCLVFTAIPFGSLTAWMYWRSLRSTLQSTV